RLGISAPPVSQTAAAQGLVGGQPPWESNFIPKWEDLLERLEVLEVMLLFAYCGLKRLGRLDAYKSRRPSRAFSMVTSSAYSRSAPTGIPTPIRVTRTPSGFSSFEM